MPRVTNEPRRLPRVATAARLILLAALCGGMAYGIASGWIVRTWEHGIAALIHESGDAGFALAHVTLEGRGRTPREDVIQALDLDAGTPMLAVDLSAARARVETLPWVHTAILRRQWPHTLHVTLSERQPIALWQHQGRYATVDITGDVVDALVTDGAPMLLVVGEDAPAHARDLLEILATQPALAQRVRAGVRFGARRWDVLLDAMDEGIRVRLPETNPQAAWDRLATLHATQAILERTVSVIDLRFDDRLVVRLRPTAANETPAAPSRG